MLLDFQPWLLPLPPPLPPPVRTTGLGLLSADKLIFCLPFPAPFFIHFFNHQLICFASFILILLRLLMRIISPSRYRVYVIIYQ